MGITVEIPVAMFHVVGGAAKENSRYAIDGVLVETPDGAGRVSVAATDGRRLIVAETDNGLFNQPCHVIVPGDVARSVVKLATCGANDDVPTATIKVDEMGDCSVTVLTNDGKATLDWQEVTDPFPPYRDVIPKWEDAPATALIGISPELVATTLKAMQKTVGADSRVRVYLPPQSDRPLVFESHGNDLKVLAVVMPVKIEEWTEQQIQGDHAVDDGELAKAAADAVWRAVPLVECLKGVKPAIIEKLEGAGITNAGQLADWQGKDHEPKVQGVGDAAIQAIDDAMVEFMATLAKSEDTPGVRPAEVLGLTGAEVEAACHANLLTPLQTGQCPTLRAVVTVEESAYLVTMPPVGHGENVYALRPLHDESQDDIDASDPYAGKIVRWKGLNWCIGNLQYLVRVSEQPAESAVA